MTARRRWSADEGGDPPGRDTAAGPGADGRALASGLATGRGLLGWLHGAVTGYRLRDPANGAEPRGGAFRDQRPSQPGSAPASPDATAVPATAVPATAVPATDAPATGAPAAERHPEAQVPWLLQQAAAWSWRLLLVGVIVYFAFKTALALRLVVLPSIAALLLTALLQPLTARLRRRMPPLAATWCTMLAAIVVLTGLGLLIANRVSAEFPALSSEVTHTAREVQSYLAGPPFHINSVKLQHYSTQLGNFLLQHKSDIAGTVLTGGRIVLELIAGLVLMIFITFFLLKDGERIWRFLTSGLRSEQSRGRADLAGRAAWTALVSYVRGTTAVAAIHAVFIGIALWLLGVPLLVPLVVLVFLAAFVPLIGILLVGALAILVTLATKGWIAALILLVVFLVENQIESHLLQPLVVGRLVRLHPLGIILALAVGGIVAGIPGAIVAVPAAAVIFYAWHAVRPPAGQPPAGRPLPGQPSAAQQSAAQQSAPLAAGSQEAGPPPGER